MTPTARRPVLPHPLLTAALALAAAGWFALPEPAAAATAITLTTPGDAFVGATLTLGYQFTVDAKLTVSSLGAFDDEGDGLFFAAPVGIWDLDGRLLASTVVPHNGEAALDQGFRYGDIAPLTLRAGGRYIIGVLYRGDFATSFGTGMGGAAAVDPHVHIEGDRFANTGRFEFPNLSADTGGAWIGPNFQFSEAVPEPAAWALLIAGFGLAGARLRSRRRAAAA